MDWNERYSIHRVVHIKDLSKIKPVDDYISSRMGAGSSCAWVWCADGKFYKRGTKHEIPPLVIPEFIDLSGGKNKVKLAGYVPSWNIFIEKKTGRATFGNYGLFINSTSKSDRMKAESMPTIQEVVEATGATELLDLIKN